ncbi:MAG: T9SS type A sorting domain-containing protein [Candidatus Aegiribacteria sp.]|nr:T9SS type A sorting domain-containing protein [Candidatus Aegiribacteria sp.]
MKLSLISIIMLLLCTGAFADIAEQTSWSGDSGVWGPVLTWGDDYDSQAGCYPVSGSLQLSLEESVHIIDIGIDYPRSVFAEDVNGDGFNDVLCVSVDSDEILWWENDGTATCWIKHVVASSFDGANQIHASDIDGDGDIDITATTFIGDEIAWWENELGNGLFWTKHTIDQNIDGPYSLYTTDLDGDADIDILASSFFGDTLSWWENIDGMGGNWIKRNIQNNPQLVIDMNIYASDIDGDGDIDVMGVNSISNNIIWCENVDGTGISWIQHIVEDNFYGGSSVHAGDVDGDGDMDILGATGSYNYIAWWENTDGAGTAWINHTISGFSNVSSISAADIDGDGDLDVLGSANNTFICLAWWENTDGTGNFSMHFFTINSWNCFSSVHAEDLNGDGDPEILATSISYNGVLRWDLGLSGWLESSVLDTESNPDWGVIDWEEEPSASCTVSFRVRSSTSPDSSQMGEWSETIYEPCSLEGILSDGDRYVQYRAILETTCLGSTPVLNSVSLSWDCQGISEEHGGVPSTLCLYPVFPNPVRTEYSVTFALPERTDINLTVYNMAGRAVETVSIDACPAGWHTATLSELEHGVYFVRMTSGSISMSGRFVVLE